MTGKDRISGATPRVPDSARGMMGHLGLKSNALSPVDSKLSSQYMVLDHMTAHYKNLNKAKAAIDNSTPKAWLISQKARDNRLRRDALKTDHKLRNQQLTVQNSDRLSSYDSGSDQELAAMIDRYIELEDDDSVDMGPKFSETTSKVNRLTSHDINLVNQLVSDTIQSPSRYHSQKIMKSYIPPNKTAHKRTLIYEEKPLTPRTIAACSLANPRANQPTDLLDKQAGCFTQKKLFTPRTLKSKPNVQSRLSTLKCYNAPKPKKSASDGPTRTVSRNSSTKENAQRENLSRPDTACTDSVDLMNETLMSRDKGHKRSPSGVPPLDISLDQDNARWMREQRKDWLYEQNKNAQLRITGKTTSDAGSEISSIRPHSAMEVHQGNSKTLNSSQNLTSEEELKYLDFLTDVTNDVIDRGIYTNRVLKQVFAHHLDKKRGVLKPEKMEEMLSSLRHELGIPDDNGDDGLGMSSTREYTTEDFASLDGVASGTGQRSRRKALNLAGEDAQPRANLPHLRAGRNRQGSGDGRPPLPRPLSRNSWSRPGSAASNLHEVKEEAEDLSISFTQSDGQSSGQADVLKIEHDEANGDDCHGDHLEGTLENLDDNPEDTFRPIEDEMLIGNEAVTNGGLDDTLTAQYTQYMDNMDESSLDVSYDEESNNGPVSVMVDQPKHKMRNDNVEETEHYSDPEYEDTFDPEPVAPKEPPKPTPRSHRSTQSSGETPRSVEITQTTDSVTVSELDDNDDEF